MGLPGIDGIEVTRQIKARQPQTEVLIFTIFEEEEKVLGAVQAGAAGYLLKGAERQVARSCESILSPAVEADARQWRGFDVQLRRRSKASEASRSLHCWQAA